MHTRNAVIVIVAVTLPSANVHKARRPSTYEPHLTISPIISGKPYKLINEKAQNLAIELSPTKAILGEHVLPGDAKKQEVGIGFPVNSYCSTHVFVVDHRVPPRRRRGNSQITG